MIYYIRNVPGLNSPFFSAAAAATATSRRVHLLSPWNPRNISGNERRELQFQVLLLRLVTRTGVACSPAIFLQSNFNSKVVGALRRSRYMKMPHFDTIVPLRLLSFGLFTFRAVLVLFRLAAPLLFCFVFSTYRIIWGGFECERSVSFFQTYLSEPIFFVFKF